ncbi:MAG: hypothetical protein WC956_04025 [bacterium]
MVHGLITTKHIILHPVTIISTWGFRAYLRMLASCFTSTPRCFTDFLHR